MEFRSAIRKFFSPPRRRFRATVTNTTNGALLADSIDVADSPASRKRGLLKHAGLALNEGLWIVPSFAVHSFGMKFDIDLVFLDRKYRVRKVRSGMKPGGVSICLWAHSVLEVPAGTVKRTETRCNDQLDFAFTEIKPRG
jgi:uncharacterized membrane protein (UPF0127 family)